MKSITEKESSQMDYHYLNFYISKRMMNPIQEYIENGVETGSFLKAIICNDLAKAVRRADEENMNNIPAFIAFFYNHAPSECWGNAANYEFWIKKKVFNPWSPPPFS